MDSETQRIINSGSNDDKNSEKTIKLINSKYSCLKKLFIIFILFLLTIQLLIYFIFKKNLFIYKQKLEQKIKNIEEELNIT